MKIKYQKRPTKKLYEVIDSDLLTATERVIKGELGGFYSIAEDQAYFKKATDKAQLSISEFEKKLRKELHANFFVVYNPTVTPAHLVQGHQIGFFVPEYNGFVPICRVGKSADKSIPANSVGKMHKFKGHKYMKSGGSIIDEEATLFRGWVAAFEACRAFILDAQVNPIKPSRTIEAKAFFVYKRIAQDLGGSARLSAAFAEGKKDALEELKRQEDKAKAEAEAKLAEEKKIEEAAIEFVETNIAEGQEIEEVQIKAEDKDAL